MTWSFHLICKWRGVFSKSGGRGKEWTLSFGFGGMGGDGSGSGGVAGEDVVVRQRVKGWVKCEG